MVKRPAESNQFIWASRGCCVLVSVWVMCNALSFHPAAQLSQQYLPRVVLVMHSHAGEKNPDRLETLVNGVKTVALQGQRSFTHPPQHPNKTFGVYVMLKKERSGCEKWATLQSLQCMLSYCCWVAWIHEESATWWRSWLQSQHRLGSSFLEMYVTLDNSTCMRMCAFLAAAILFFLYVTQLHFIKTIYNEYNKAANNTVCVMWLVRNPRLNTSLLIIINQWFLRHHTRTEQQAATHVISSRSPLQRQLKKMFEVELIFCSLCRKIQSVRESPLTSHTVSAVFFYRAAPENWSSLQIMPTCWWRPLPGHVRKISYCSSQFGSQLNGGSEELSTDWCSSCLCFYISVPCEVQHCVHSHALWLFFFCSFCILSDSHIHTVYMWVRETNNL